MGCSPPASSVHGILQARVLEWVANPSPADLPNPVIEPASLMSPALADGFLTTSNTGEKHQYLRKRKEAPIEIYKKCLLKN